jgi:hypothetical protein
VLVTPLSQWEALVHITLKIPWRTTSCGWSYKKNTISIIIPTTTIIIIIPTTTTTIIIPTTTTTTPTAI